MHSLTRLVMVGLGIAVLAAASATTAAAQTKEARGKVVAVTDGSLIVQAGQQSLTFIVDPSTQLEARGAGRRTREAANPGSAPVKITDYVKNGGAVLVNYRESGGANHALLVRPISDDGGKGGSIGGTAAKTVNGKVKSITAGALTLEQDGRDMTLAVGNETGILVRGASKVTKPAGGRVPVTSLVHAGDLVSVDYQDDGGALTASQIRIRGANTIAR